MIFALRPSTAQDCQNDMVKQKPTKAVIFIGWVGWWSIDGGNSNIVYFYPDPWGNDPLSLIFFSDGLKPPTSDEFLSEERVGFTTEILQTYH